MNLLIIHIACWLIPLLVGIICALLGYLLGRLFRKGNNNEDITILNSKISKLEVSLKSCSDEKSKLKTALDTTKKDLKHCEKNKSGIALSLKEVESKNLSLAASLTTLKTTTVTLIPFNNELAKSVFGKKIKENDLKIVEGIGPKIEGLFHDFDIKTWKQLSEASIEKCQEVLNSGGDRYRIHKPTTWPKQAKLAYEGKWEALLKWQDELDGGK
ncbi:hypothetical protein PG913_12730 [Tenacibaculum pacificus]|uniref:hypothetical protein n=1 Tax=Tenacibaculum pacificus TaxID=3018314 RepID=UPI0022F380FB|nr:hypothetical protein [Tenacibaculum pacificus]WBX73671.1 hypothetical protein PG913_12730 [Tenacibaculum pacificus]